MPRHARVANFCQPLLPSQIASAAPAKLPAAYRIAGGSNQRFAAVRDFGQANDRLGSWLCKNDFGAASSAILIQADRGSRTKDSRGTRARIFYCLAAAPAPWAPQRDVVAGATEPNHSHSTLIRLGRAKLASLLREGAILGGPSSMASSILRQSWLSCKAASTRCARLAICAFSITAVGCS